MESITVYPNNKKQESLLKSLLEEMRIRFETGKGKKSHSLFSKGDFYTRIDKSIKQVESGKTKVLTKDRQKEFLGL